MKQIRAAAGFFALSLSCAPLLAQDVAVKTFTPPQRDQFRNPQYPSLPLMRGEEGAVEMQFMVDPAGRPYEITVTNSTGDPAFGREAVRAVENSIFRPAMLDGEPIAGSFRTLIRFSLATADEEGQRGARRQFARNYRKFRDIVESDRAAAAEVLAEMEQDVTNHYEVAYLNLARFMLAKHYGTTLDQMEFLHAALGFVREVDDQSYLPAADVGSALRELFRLQATNKYFSEALATYHLLEAKGDTEAVAAYAGAVAEIRALKADERPFGIPVTLDAAGVAELSLLKDDVYVEQVTGKVAEFKLRCSQHYVGFAVETDVSYHVPAEWGECYLEILGDGGSSFTLVQH